MDVVDSTKHMAEGGVKDAEYLAKQMIPIMLKVDPHRVLFNMAVFDGAGNVQKGGLAIGERFPHVITIHGGEHVCSLFVAKVFQEPCMKLLRNFTAIVSCFVSISFICLNYQHRAVSLIVLFPRFLVQEHLRLDASFRICHVPRVCSGTLWQGAGIHEAVRDAIWRQSDSCPSAPQVEGSTTDVYPEAAVRQEKQASQYCHCTSEGVCLGLCLCCLSSISSHNAIDTPV